MRATVLAAVACAALAAGCSDPCQELGDRLCDCRDPGVTKASCTQGVQTEVQRLHPDSDAKSACSRALDTCHGPSSDGNGQPVDFCDYLNGRCGKAACGMSAEDIGTLQTTQVDPACVPTDTAPCPVLCSK